MRTRTLLALTAVGAAAAAVFLSVEPAHADPADGPFIETLADFGVPMPGGASGAIDVAHIVCADLAAGYNHMQVVANVYVANVEYSVADAGHFVGAATAAYCPLHNLPVEVA